MSARVLVIDDMTDLHRVFRRLLEPKQQPVDLARLEASLFGPGEAPKTAAGFEVDCAAQGQEGLEMVRKALAEGRPYALAIVDMRMPPGWDGVQTIEAIWRDDPDIEIAICSAHSDYSEEDLTARLGAAGPVPFLRKPFDAGEVRQLVKALTEKWFRRHEPG